MELNVLQSDDPLPVEPNSPRFPGSEKKGEERDKKKKRKNRWHVTCAHIPMSKNCRCFFRKDYRRFFNATSIQTRLQRTDSLAEMIYTHERDGFPRKELVITRWYDHFERSWFLIQRGNYNENREMD